MGIELRPFIDQAGKPEIGKAPTGYLRPEQVEFDDGTTLARYMPMSIDGKQMRGVVIPHAKPLGGSRAYDPHKPPHKRVCIDPHIEGQSVVVDLDRITPDLAEEAMQLGQEFADRHADEVHGVDQIRLRSSAAFHLIGASQRAQGPAQSAQPVQQVPPPGTGQVITLAPGSAQAAGAMPAPPPAAAVAAPAPGPRAIKAASFNGTRPQAPPAGAKGGLLDAYQKVRPPRQVDVEPAVTTGLPIEPPSKKVTFGIPGFGLHEAHYHDVNISDQLFVLVWDERFQGGSKYLPQIDGSFAARVEDDPVDYKLVWPGQMFTDKRTGQTYFQLLIEERVSQGEAQ
jgi:hypothetical protein